MVRLVLEVYRPYMPDF